MYRCITSLRCMLLIVYICVISAKTFHDVHHDQQIVVHRNKRTIERMTISGITDQSEKTDISILGVIQKEPKFFDEFECKFLQNWRIVIKCIGKHIMKFTKIISQNRQVHVIMFNLHKNMLSRRIQMMIHIFLTSVIQSGKHRICLRSHSNCRL